MKKDSESLLISLKHLYEADFWETINKTAGCWTWKDPKNRVTPGYYVQPLKQTYSARNIAYQLTRGQITAGARVYSTCGNKECLNPAHFETRKPKQPSNETGTSVIYGLASSSDGVIRYVGHADSLTDRLYQHVSVATRKSYTGEYQSTNRKDRWIRSVLNNGATVQAQTLQVCIPQDKAYWERFWGQIYESDSLLNTVRLTTA